MVQFLIRGFNHNNLFLVDLYYEQQQQTNKTLFIYLYIYLFIATSTIYLS